MKLIDIANDYAERISDAQVAQMFKQCFMSTYDTTAKFEKDGSCFVITGDIPAMWLRDSSAQVNHYVRFANECPQAYNLVLGLLRRQIRCILSDPYANAFNQEANGHGHQEDRTQQSPDIWERKYEVDSLCYPIRLAYRFWKEAGTAEHFTPEFRSAMETIVDLWRVEQNHAESPYYFERINCPQSDTLLNEGRGTPVSYTGMTWSAFRPSDDACKYGYLVPANMFAYVVLGYMEEIAKEIYQDDIFARKAGKLRNQIKHGIEEYTIIEVKNVGRMYAYETDGLGGYNLMDDANVPSLLAMPYFGYCSKDDELYQNTRKFILSEMNPYYYSGTAAKGIGSPHTPANHVWPIALCMQGLTAMDDKEIHELIQTLISIDAGTGFMHESVNVDDPDNFTRPWFSWANTLFAELVMKYIDEGGHL